MSQISALIDVLKKVLKAREITYASLADQLGMSEANVKRMFSKRNFTLNRLDDICRIANVELSELLDRVQQDQIAITKLSIKQEQELVSDHRLLLIAVLTINNWSIDEMFNIYNFTMPEIIGFLTKLDRMNIIELLPENRTRLLISRSFTWQKGGPVQQFFAQNVPGEFFDCEFDPQRGELLQCMFGMLTRESNTHIQRGMSKLMKEFEHFAKEDAKLPAQETFGTCLVSAVRPWEVNTFAQFRREPNKKFF